MAKEIRNLQALVDTVAEHMEREVKAGKLNTLKGLLWYVPTKILAEHAKEEGKKK